MDGAGYLLLPGARRTEDHDPAVGGRNTLDRLTEMIHRPRRPDQLVAITRPMFQLGHLPPQPGGFERTIRDQHKSIRLERLFDIIVGAPLDRGHSSLDVAVAGDDHDR